LLAVVYAHPQADLAHGLLPSVVQQTTPYNNMTLTCLMGDHPSTWLPLRYTSGMLRKGEVRYTTPNLTLPTRSTFTGQVSYVSDDATDLGSSGFGLMFYREASRAVLWRVGQSRRYDS
jgi:hypothetical protein